VLPPSAIIIIFAYMKIKPCITAALKKLFVIFAIFLTAFFYSSCGDNPSDASNEVILFSKDTLSVYSADSLITNGLQLYGVQRLEGNKKYGLYFTASTNDSSVFSHLYILAHTCQEPPCSPPMIRHIDEQLSGNSINTSYGKTFLVERSDSYNLRASVFMSFDTNYHNPGKYIKLQNIKFSRFD
jgi:hypothetical protein